LSRKISSVVAWPSPGAALANLVVGAVDEEKASTAGVKGRELDDD
jgi:hypothetical protein